MKKFWLVLLSLICSISMTIVLTSCGQSDKSDDEEIKGAEYMVTFNTDGGSEVASQTVRKGEKITKPEVPIKNGYDFDGWYAGDEVWSFVDYVVTDNMTLTAKWNISTYSINYVLNGGDNNEANPTRYRIDTETITFFEPTKSGYVFDGWYTEDTFVNKVTELTTGSYGDKTFYAKWNKIIYSEGLNYELLEDDTYAVVGMGSCVDTELVIPEIYNGKPVTEIAENAFSGKRRVTEITFPETIRKVGKDAFLNCGRLSKIDIHDLSAWLNIDFKGTIGSNTKEYKLYLNGKQVTDVIIPNGMEMIKPNVFSGCAGLKSVTIPNSVITIGSAAFAGCIDLEFVKFGNSVQNISVFAFLGCGFKEIEIPDSVTTIEQFAFAGCEDLKSVVIGNNVTHIGMSAFQYCTNLLSVTISESLSVMDNLAFYSCNKLADIYIKNIESWCAIVGLEGLMSDYCGAKSKRLYLNGKEITELIIPEGVTTIENYAFAGCNRIVSVSIPDSVTSVGASSFYGCDQLKYNEYDNAYYLGNSNNPYLVLIKAKDKTITSDIIHEKTKVICDHAFHGCSELASVTIGNNVVNIGDFAFSECRGLTNIIIPNSVTRIGERTFESCSGLTSIEIPDNVTSLGEYAFFCCSGLKSVTIGNGITSIGEKTFYGCVELTTITIPDGIISIGYSAFEDCNLTSITIPVSVTNIEGRAFWGYRNLKSITYEGTIAEWEKIVRGDNWNNSKLVVHCTDGDINIE